MVSFIVPAYNEELELPATLAAIHAAGKRANEYEIIVADDGSTDQTARLARDHGAKVVFLSRRQIAAARNAGARAARGDILFFVDADTHINSEHVRGAIDALERGFAGGGARVAIRDPVPWWARISVGIFCVIYFGLNLGAGAFLFTTRNNFETIDGFDETLFIGEEVYFSLALRKLGQFKILSEPIVTSGRKLRLYSAAQIFKHSMQVILRGPRGARSRAGLDIWYDGKRETSLPGGRTRPLARSTITS